MSYFLLPRTDESLRASHFPFRFFSLLRERNKRVASFTNPSLKLIPVARGAFGLSSHRARVFVKDANTDGLIQ